MNLGLIVQEANRACDRLARRLPFPAAIAVEACHKTPNGQLLGCEKEIASEFARPRFETFAEGRRAARSALTKLSGPQLAIGQDSHGRPMWPDTFCGSITHIKSLAVAIVCFRRNVAGVGIDVEEVGALEDNLIQQVIAKGEPITDDPTLLFSIKESSYKCISLWTDRPIDFPEAVAEIFESRNRFKVRPSRQQMTLFPEVSGLYEQSDELWFTLGYVIKGACDEDQRYG